MNRYQQGRELTRLAVMLTLHLFIRSSELRFARWSEIDFRNSIWIVPARPLTKSGIPVVEPKCTLHTSYHCLVSYYPVEKIKEISGHPELIFPGDRDPDRPMSENTINRALRLMGYDTKTEVCGHGFRTMACSVLIESGMWSQDR